MFKKSMFALTAAIAFGSVSSAFAYEAPENKIGDRYPALEQKYSYERSSSAGTRMRAATSGYSMSRQYTGLDQYVNEAPENRISDRYPLLERSVKPVASGRFAGPYLASRQARVSSVSYQYINEAPENKIGDRYPLLEPTYGRGVTSRTSTAGRSRQATRG